jgi:NAD(P)-dependent dehydrogenase (short-subunit alcohol dehydrogenase family)
LRFVIQEGDSVYDFTNQVVLVTGAGRGLGRALALAFAAHGATVAANDLTPINLDETVRLAEASGGFCQPFIFDIAKKMPVQGLVEQVREQYGRIDVLVNNAAVKPRLAILEMDEWDWLRTLDVNLNGPFYLIQSIGRVMKERGGGAILNITGVATGQPNYAAYAASKAALSELTRQAAHELSSFNIRVNAICPGGMPLASAAPPAETGGDPEAVTGLALFLCSPQAGAINGQIFDVPAGSGSG